MARKFRYAHIHVTGSDKLSNFKVGKGTIIHPDATIADGVIIGNNCRIHEGARIGSYGSVVGRDKNGIMEINKKASVSKVNFASASELANAVLKDYSLTNKLLKLVNSAFYGQFAGKITTVSRAVVVLGFEQVSMAASSLMLFDQLKNKGQKEVLRELFSWIS